MPAPSTFSIQHGADRFICDGNAAQAADGAGPEAELPATAASTAVEAAAAAEPQPLVNFAARRLEYRTIAELMGFQAVGYNIIAVRAMMRRAPAFGYSRRDV